MADEAHEGEERDFYGLLLPFDSDDPEFTRGFEVGHVYTVCKLADEPVTVTMHATNAEMAMRIGEATGRKVHSRELVGGSSEDPSQDWIEVTFE